MRLSCNFINVYTIAYRVQYTFTRVHARIPNGHSREEKRPCRTSRRTSRRGSSCVSGSWQAEPGSCRTRRHSRDDPLAEVGEYVRVGVGVRVDPVEFQLYHRGCVFGSRWRLAPFGAPRFFLNPGPQLRFLVSYDICMSYSLTYRLW